MNIFDTNQIRSILPKKIKLVTSNGEFELNQSDCIVAPPVIQITYHHSTPEKTGDVLSDGEPDYLGFDVGLVKNGRDYKYKVDTTYGDAMMFSFDILPNNTIKVGHYNGFGSKFDPEYKFYFVEQSIEDLMNFFNNLLPGYNIPRNQFNFLDGDENSFKMEKVNHRRIVDFRGFSPQGLL
jgi:hypothetical protein